jgi:hypothetical protein
MDVFRLIAPDTTFSSIPSDCTVALEDPRTRFVCVSSLTSIALLI